MAKRRSRSPGRAQQIPSGTSLPTGKRAGPKLSDDDLALWNAVKKTVDPLASRSFSQALSELEEPRPAQSTRLPNGVVDRPLPSSTDLSKELSADGSGEANGRSPRKTLRPAGRGMEPSISVRMQAPIQAIDRKTKAKIARGRIAIEARIDLHGMTQQRAHRELNGFLVRAFHEGLKVVLVITGKGDRDGEMGVLRQAVPRWLSEPSFRTYVNGVEEAHTGHGGAGALYVRLKRRG